MLYKKINLEIIVPADETDAVVAQLDSAIDRVEENHTIFGGGIQTTAVEHSGTRRKTAFMHTVTAGEAAIGAIKVARGAIVGALREII